MGSFISTPNQQCLPSSTTSTLSGTGTTTTTTAATTGEGTTTTAAAAEAATQTSTTSEYNLDRYWNYVAVPFLLFVISVAIYIIFTTTGSGISDGKERYLTLMRNVKGKIVKNASVGTNNIGKNTK